MTYYTVTMAIRLGNVDIWSLFNEISFILVINFYNAPAIQTSHCPQTDGRTDGHRFKTIPHVKNPPVMFDGSVKRDEVIRYCSTLIVYALCAYFQFIIFYKTCMCNVIHFVFFSCFQDFNEMIYTTSLRWCWSTLRFYLQKPFRFFNI